MLGKMIYKEMKLALHPASIMFMCFGAMLLIPSYPYSVVFFYGCLGIFFVCLTGRENKDIFYSILLPIRKRDIVRARFVTVCMLQVMQLVIGIPFAILRSSNNTPNIAGMDANPALFGLALIYFGFFNIVFFGIYYRNPEKVGKAFLFGSGVLFLLILVEEVATFVVPFVKNLDTMGPEHLASQLVALAAGAVVYAVTTVLAYLKAAKNFEKLDI